MAGEWVERPLGELVENFDGVRIPVKESDRRPGPYPYYGASGVVDHVDGYLFDGEYLLIAEDGENLRTRTTPIAFLARGKFWVNNHAHIVRGNREADTRFLMYALSATDISGYLTGSTMPKLTQGNMNRIPVLTPPLPEQRAIAHILGTLDDKIELNRRMSETLEAMAQALFQAWFVDFEPVRAKMEGRWKRGQSLPGLPAHLYDLFPDRLVDSELGEIPEGWEVRSIGEIIRRLPVGKKYDQKTVNPIGKVPVLDQGKTGIIGYHDDEPSIVASEEYPVAVFANHTCYMRLIYFPFSTIQNVIPFVGQGVDTIWLFYATCGKQSFTEYKGHWPDFVIHKIVVPYPEVADQFSRLIHPLLKIIWAKELESRTLAALRDALLPKLISGELRVKDAEGFLEERGL
ncbi:type I restriction system specificity protein [Thermostichus vulcanus NIES-2134]|nr:type I restriction system specificity protein [Thermostichus vulcanus NIES-2134]